MKKIIIFLGFCLPVLGWSQVDLTYQEPHQNIMELANVSMTPSMSITPDGDKAVLIYRNQYKSIEDLSEDELRLAGLRINPKTNISSRTRFYTDLKLFDPQQKEEQAIEGMPSNPKISNISWSPEYNFIAFTHTTDTGNELWVIDYKKKSASQLTDAIINGNMGTTLSWFPDESALLVKALPEDRPDLINTGLKVPTGPTVSVNEAGVEAQNRTYQDLLTNKDDEINFEVLATSEIHKVELNGDKSLWKPAAMYRSMSFSPDGNYVMLSEVKKPFSYIVTYGRFPTSYNIFNSAGDLAHFVADIPLIEEQPKGFMSTRTGPRSMSWRNDHPATLVWVEALDEGDANKEVDYRDEVYQLKAPFDGDKDVLAKTKLTN